MTSGIRPASNEAVERADDLRIAALTAALGERSIVLVGLMGSGKSSTGRRLAQRLGLPFVDADTEIELAAGMTIAEIFAAHGEAFFRDGERRVMARLLADGQRVVATGGGAFMNAETRQRIAEHGISVWLKADPEVLWRRVRKRSHRPLLQGADAETTLRALMEVRYPVYAGADITVTSRDGPHEIAVEETLAALEYFLGSSPDRPSHRPRSDRMNVVGLPPRATDFSAQRESVRETVRETVHVSLGEGAYRIVIGPGLIREAGASIAQLAQGAACAIVTDATVARLHLPALEASLDAAGVRHARVVVPPGEGSKSIATFAELCEALIATKLERSDLVVALGGGVVGDLAGFAAATVRRGTRFVQIPTTLLAQVDSSVGGKTGINSRHGKNLIGAFHQPSLVLADTNILETLPPRELRAGYAEIVKYGIIGDASFFARLESGWRDVLGGKAALVDAIATSCAAKAAIVSRDELEQGERALLNFGHTFGHALEQLTGYDGARLVHGEAVAIGMILAMRLSERLGLCPQDDRQRVEAHLNAAGLPTRVSEITGFDAGAEAVLQAMYQDKKVERGALTFILAHRIGDCFIAKNVDAGEIVAFLRDEAGLPAG
jgi:shikimate kinase/3-dehydroquinate synthase